SALVFGPLFGPLVMGAILSVSLERNISEADKPVTVMVSHAERAPNLMAHLRQHGAKVETVSYDDATAREVVKSHQKAFILAIPEDFDSRFRSSQPAQLLLYVDSSDASNNKDVVRVKTLLSQYGALVAHLRIMARGVDPLVLSPIVLHDLDVSTP